MLTIGLLAAMRISDEDRKRAVEELRRHCSAGRLPVDEYATRVADALSAETLADLDGAMRDLPILRIADPQPHPPVFAPEHRSEPGAGHSSAALAFGGSLLAAGAVVAFLVVAHWLWAVIVVAAWLLGLAQGRAARRRRS